MKLFKRIVCISSVILPLLTGSIGAAGETFSLSYEAISQAEEHLERAALDGPQRSKQDTIHRDVHDIVFLLEQSWKAAGKSDDTLRRDYAQQALRLLEQSAAGGYFDRAKVQPVLVLIRQLLAERIGSMLQNAGEIGATVSIIPYCNVDYFD